MWQRVCIQTTFFLRTAEYNFASSPTALDPLRDSRINTAKWTDFSSKSMALPLETSEKFMPISNSPDIYSSFHQKKPKIRMISFTHCIQNCQFLSRFCSFIWDDSISDRLLICKHYFSFLEIPVSKITSCYASGSWALLINKHFYQFSKLLYSTTQVNNMSIQGASKFLHHWHHLLPV